MSILSFPRVNFRGVFRTNPCTANNDDVLGKAVRRADDTFGCDLSKKKDDEIHAFLRERVMMSNGEGWPCNTYLRAGWNLYGDHFTTFDDTVITSVVTGPDAAQRAADSAVDPLIGQAVLLLGSVSSDPMRRESAIICDLDPTGLITTQLWVGGLQIGSGGESGSDPAQIVALFDHDTRAFQNWLHFASTVGEPDGSPYGLYKGEQNFVGIGCVMQFGIPAAAIPQVTFRSPALEALLAAARRASGLVVRFRCFEVQPIMRTDQLFDQEKRVHLGDPNPAEGYLIGTIGVWLEGEPETEVPGRKLEPPYPRDALSWQAPGTDKSSTVPGCPLPWAGAPALVGNVVAHVHAEASRISLDLVNAFPKSGYRDPSGPSEPDAGGFDAPRHRADLGPLELAVLPAGGGAPVTIAPLDYGVSDYGAYEDFGGIVDVPFPPALAGTIAGGLLVIRAAPGNQINPGAVVALREAPIRLVTDDRGVYLMPGEQKAFRIKLSERGGPTTRPTDVHLLEYMNIITSQAGEKCHDGVRPNQTVTESASNGILRRPATVTIPAGAGFSGWFAIEVGTTGIGDATILSYQLDAAPFGTSVPAWSTAVYSSVRVYANEDYSHLYAAGPLRWKDVYAEVLRFYYLIYPAMSEFIQLNDLSSILRNKAALRERLHTSDEKAFYSTYNMPLTRTMSPAKVKLLLDFLDQQR